MSLRAQISLVLVALGCAIWAAPGMGAPPTISGSDADVWSAATTPTYTITGSAEGAKLRWVLLGGGSVARGPDDLVNRGESPLTIPLPGLRDDDYRLFAMEVGERGLTQRRFAVDTTPPRVQIDTPAAGTVFAQGQQVATGYRCDERSCVGTVPAGDPLPTATPGLQSFIVTATDGAGNVTTVQHDYTVAAPLTPAPLVPTTPAVVAPAPAPMVLPPPENARRLRPRLGAKLRSTRPVLRWKAHAGAKFYNVQIFRLAGKRLVKVLSVFPRTNHVRVPPRRLTRGATHVWRVWPMVGGRYTAKPLGISNFEVRRSAGRAS
jgi:hypothetical protein